MVVNMLRKIHAIVKSPKVKIYGERRSTCFKPNGDREHDCPCGTTVKFHATTEEINNLVAVFHDDDCYNAHKEDFFTRMPLKASLMPSGGMRDDSETETFDSKGDDMIETTVQESEAAPDKEPVVRVPRGNCVECGGEPGRARGWKHTPTCSLSTANKLAAKAATAGKCPTCSGPKRGRGFTHTEACTEK